MIYTVTFNPSLDYVVSADNFRLGYTNRTKSERMFPGGKGINVSMVLQKLGRESIALGFTAGFTGEEIKRCLAEKGVKTEFIQVQGGFSRINVKLLSIDGTEINGKGPEISKDNVQEMQDRLEQLQEGDILVLAGSVPASMPPSVYEEIAEHMKDRKVRLVVDAAGDLLRKVLKYHPFLIKPNHHELGELFGVSLTTREEVLPYGRKLQEMGARNVLISLGKEGAVLVAEDGRIFASAAIEGEVINSVGAGDSMVAGFLSGWLEKQDYEQAFYMGLAAGSASAFSEKLAEGEEIISLYQRLL